MTEAKVEATVQDRCKATPRRSRLWRRLRRLGLAMVALVSVPVVMLSCALTPPNSGSIDGADRLQRLDGTWPGLTSDVEITWDEHLIPSIYASGDEDTPYAIGLVHAHLRLAQMEIIRRVSQGRLSEMAGPFAVDIDEAIRAVDLDRAVDDIEQNLAPRTRAWFERYVEGINAYRKRHVERPSDARVLAIDFEEAWTVRDVLILARLMSVDVNWGRVLRFARLRNEQGYDDFAARLWRFADDGVPSFGAGQPHDLSLLTDIGRSGSNAFVVSGEHSSSGGALVASDPHLGLPQPNIWCIIGYRTPEHAAVGLTIPGIPFVLVGRNEQIAWTGTNMQSSSSVFYALPDGWDVAAEREEDIRVRLWPDSSRTLRDSSHGPVITDSKLLGSLFDGDVALRWRGHEVSDEPTAFFDASRATDWDGFRSSFRTYAAGGQNMLFGDAAGNIGQLMAVEAIPAAAAASRLGVVSADDERYQWTDGIPSTSLPAASNPSAGHLVSANNIPTREAPALVPQGNANDRVQRMSDLLTDRSDLTIDDLVSIQLDTYSASSHRLAGLISERLAGVTLDVDSRALAANIARWDGRYETDSTGAMSYQAVLAALIDALYADRYSDRVRGTIRSGPYVHTFVFEDLEQLEGTSVLREALASAAVEVSGNVSWGDRHRLQIAHPIGFAPVLGRGYIFDNLPYRGSTGTIAKAAHAVTADRHNTTFGANARLLCDLGTLDENRVVLLGGQDGWIGSDRMLDMVELWQAGSLVPLPLSERGQRDRAIQTTSMQSAPPSS